MIEHDNEGPIGIEEPVNADSIGSEKQTEETGFAAFHLMPELQRAIDAMGFVTPTDIQVQAIPLLRRGADIIGRSQTGTGKTMAFAIPAVEIINREEAEPTVQVLILCPTRELAQQSCEEIKKLIRFMLNVWPAEVYGGAAIDRQVFRLKRANLVIGTPGRIMDHMRRGTLTLSHVRLVVLDEADEMLSMGFREDIETILQDVPAERQTALFSATMPDAILKLTERFMHDPQMIDINRAHVTLDEIHQMFMDVPMGRKLDALNLLLRAREPVRTMVFCNTKLMVDEVSAYLNRNGFGCEGIHGDMNQSQRTRVMEGFKAARIPILVATDVAARGIDVNDIDYVINYDLPQNSEIYVHRIGRTGRAGKHGTAITLCSGRRQLFGIRDISRIIRSRIEEIPIPTVAEIRLRQDERNLEQLRTTLSVDIPMEYKVMVGKLMSEGHEPAIIASAAMQLCFQRDETGLSDIIRFDRKTDGGRLYRKLIINIGRSQKAAPNHIVSAIASQANIRGSEIGKIEIYNNKTIVGVPDEHAEAIERAMQGATICGQPVHVKLSDDRLSAKPSASGRNVRRPDGNAARKGNPHERRNSVATRAPLREAGRGKVRLSPEARTKLLEATDLSRFEFRHERRGTPRRSYDDLPGEHPNRRGPGRGSSRRGRH